jgi:hypothetical protein
LARLLLAAWHRGWNFLNDNKKFPTNPRLPVNRGFFVGKKQIPARAGQTKEKMKTNYKRVPARFGPETRFEVTPAPPAPFRAIQETELERLKTRLLLGFLGELAEREFIPYVRRAANEAAALAWVMPYPLLTFPGLFEEKVKTALLYAERQATVRERSADLVLV